MRIYICIFFLWLMLDLASQSIYKFPDKFNSVYNFHPESVLKQVDEEKDDLRKKALQKYIVNYVYAEQFSFDINQMYLDWGEAETYLLKLLDTIINKGLKDKKLDIFIERSPTSNASASRYGNIAFNIGMFCDAENEAFLATVISHEAAHYLFQHKIKELKMSEGVIGGNTMSSFVKTFQRYEQQADSFAIANVKKFNLSLESVVKWNESMDVQEDFYLRGRSYKRMLKASDISDKDMRKKKGSKYNAYASHPSFLTRYDYAKREMEKCKTCKKNFLVDSAYFFKIRKIASEERKKITFESCDFNGCLTASFMDYLYGSKGPKNLYYIVESIRRLIYAKPSLTNIGFLTEYIEDPDLGVNGSVLEKPDYLYGSIQDYNRLKDHPFIIGEKKPFRSYLDAFLYFSHEAVSKGLNEANLSLGLYYHSVKRSDSSEKYLQKYVDNGNGVSIEFAKTLLKYKKPSIPKGKSLIIYNNIGNYTVGDFNYYLCLKKKSENPNVRKELRKDTTTTDLIILNELLGASPQRLYIIQKLLTSVVSLYDEDDIQMCKKVRLNSHFANEDQELSDVFKNHLLVFAPEWYTWLKDNNYDRIFYVDMIYQYKEYMEGEEYYNDYTGYYLDMNQSRPYFKDSFRNGFTRKQKDKDMYKEMNDFLGN